MKPDEIAQGTRNSPCTITRNAQHGLASIGEESTLPNTSSTLPAQTPQNGTYHGHGDDYTTAAPRRITFAPEVDSHHRHNGNTSRTSSYTSPWRFGPLPT